MIASAASNAVQSASVMLPSASMAIDLGVGALGHKLGHALGMAVAGMEDNNSFSHEKSSLEGLKKGLVRKMGMDSRSAGMTDE
jgi:hypothetical protein